MAVDVEVSVSGGVVPGASVAGAAPPELVEPEAARLLVVDDEPVICEILRDVLTFEGFDVTVAGGGVEAVELLKQNRFAYDLILSDLKMPTVSGLDLLHRIGDEGLDAVVIIMTGFGTVETAIEAMKRGAFDYLLKPFKPEEVVRVVRRGLEKLRLERENTALRESVSFYELSEALSSPMPLDEQLELLASMAREQFEADGISIIIEDPKRPGHYIERMSQGVGGVLPKSERIIKTFLQGNRLLSHGEQVRDFLTHPESAEYRVHAMMAAPLRIRGAPFGFMSAVGVRHGARFTEGQRKGLSIFGGRAATAIETARMYGNLRETFTQTIEGFARALEAKDAYTHGHSDRVAMYSRLIAQSMGLAEKDVERIQHGGLMHDVGKIGISSGDLNKPQKLTPAEYLMFKSHPVQGKRIIEPISFLVHLVPCVYYHHEAYDGSGYPEGLGGVDIPLEARILAVADSYDAMTSNRPYRKALPHEIAIAEFKRCAGKQFDPKVVEAFLGTIESHRQKLRNQGLPVPD